MRLLSPFTPLLPSNGLVPAVSAAHHACVGVALIKTRVGYLVRKDEHI